MYEKLNFYYFIALFFILTTVFLKILYSSLFHKLFQNLSSPSSPSLCHVTPKPSMNRKERALVAADENAGFVLGDKAKNLARVAARNQRNRPKRPRSEYNPSMVIHMARPKMSDQGTYTILFSPHQL